MRQKEKGRLNVAQQIRFIIAKPTHPSLSPKIDLVFIVIFFLPTRVYKDITIHTYICNLFRNLATLLLGTIMIQYLKWPHIAASETDH